MGEGSGVGVGVAVGAGLGVAVGAGVSVGAGVFVGAGVSAGADVSTAVGVIDATVGVGSGARGKSVRPTSTPPMHAARTTTTWNAIIHTALSRCWAINWRYSCMITPFPGIAATARH